MEETPYLIIKKLDTVIFDENIPSNEEIQNIKERLVPVMQAIDYFKTVNDEESSIDTIQSARRLLAKAGIALAIKDFVNSDVIEKLS
ncbi:MAG: hypothetical protein PHG23_01065 [Candidatus Pacebacteria bacterium]|nr:hypothetical protein [Candidatus Paceibacterota bacterium]